MTRTIFALLLLGTGAAHAYSNPNPRPTGTPLPVLQNNPDAISEVKTASYTAAECATLPPSKTTCVEQRWVVSCGAQYGASNPNDPGNPCAPYAQQVLAAYGAAQDPNATPARVFDTSTQQFADSFAPISLQHLVGVGKNATAHTWAAQEEKAKVNAFNNPFVGVGSLVTPKDFTRFPFASTAVPMATCEEFVYRRYYDVERWIDAMNACKNDARCVAKVSMNGMGVKTPAKMPGIARRTMTDLEGNPIKDHLYKLYLADKVSQAEVDPFTPEWHLWKELPKNGFYSATGLFFVPALIDAFKATGQDAVVQALANELHRGAQLDYIDDLGGHSGGSPYIDSKGAIHRGYYDEWDYHRTLEHKTAGVTVGESREYRRRANAVLAQLDLLSDEMKCMIPDATKPGGCGAGVPSAIGKVRPGDWQMWQVDPMASRSIFNSITAEQWVSPPALQGRVGFGTVLQPSALSLDQLLAGVAIGGLDLLGSTTHVPGMVQLSGTTALAAPSPAELVAPAPNALVDARAVGGGDGMWHTPPGQINLTGPAPAWDASSNINLFNLRGVLQQLWTVNPPVIDASSPTPKLKCEVRRRLPPGGGRGIGDLGGVALNVDETFHTERVWRDVCVLMNLVLTEWGRYQQGEPSCLDPKSSACDWMPQDFVDRFVTQNVGYAAAAKEQDYRQCKRFTGGGDMTSTNIAGEVGIPSAQRKSLFLTQMTLDAREAGFIAKMKNIPIAGQDEFGTVREDKQHIGDDQFGGGYDYSLGWHLTVFKRYDDAQLKADTEAGTAPPDAEKKIGWPCRVGGNLDAKFKAGATIFGNEFNVLDAKGLISSNEADDARAYVNSKLYVVGYDIFDTHDLDGAAANGDFDLTYALNKTTTDGGKPQLVEVPFQVGPVTVTVSAGVAYDYGVTIQLGVGSAPKDSCNVTATIFGAHALFTPFADLGVWVDADASIAGGLLGVGVEVDLTLLGLQLPFDVKLALAVEQNVIGLSFDAKLDLVLITLKGELDFYLKAFWAKVASFTIVKWDGFTHRFPVFRTPHTLLPLAQLPEGTIEPLPTSAGGDPKTM